jgi:hypothetical protein
VGAVFMTQDVEGGEVCVLTSCDGTRQAMSCDVTLWRVRVVVLQWTQQCVLCVLKSRVTLSAVLHNNAIMVNLYQRQQCKLHVPVFKRSYIVSKLQCFTR